MPRSCFSRLLVGLPCSFCCPFLGVRTDPRSSSSLLGGLKLAGCCVGEPSYLMGLHGFTQSSWCVPVCPIRHCYWECHYHVCIYIYKYYIIVKVTVVGTLSYLPTECRAAVKPCFSWSLKSPLPPTADSCRDRGRRRELTVAASPNSHTTYFLRLQTL